MIITIRVEKARDTVTEDQIAQFVFDMLDCSDAVLSVIKITVGTETYFVHNGVLKKLKKIF